MRTPAVVLVLFCLLLFFSQTLPAYAATITVNTLADGDNVPGCSLREAITSANLSVPLLNGCEVGGGADIITLTLPGVYTLDGEALPTIISTITIQPLLGTAIIEAAAAANAVNHRVFEVGAGGSLTLNNLTIRHGGSDGFVGGVGGCIAVTGDEAALSLVNVVVEDCRIGGDGGAGGGVGGRSDLHTISILNSTIRNNISVAGGGGIAALGGGLSMEGVTVSGNVSTSGAGYGGGVYFYGLLSPGLGTVATINNSTISGNTGKVGGGLYALTPASVTIDWTTFAGNDSTQSGGAIYLTGTGDFVMHNSVVTGNSAGLFGGGIYAGDVSVLVWRSRLQNNTAVGSGSFSGSAYYTTSDEAQRVQESCIVGNTLEAVFVHPSSSGEINFLANWWGTHWGPRIAAAGGGSAVSNGDSVGGNVNVGLIDAGAENGMPVPAGNWATSAPTVAGAACLVCAGVSSIGHGRMCA